jgi:hypothetical protein
MSAFQLFVEDQFERYMELYPNLSFKQIYEILKCQWRWFPSDVKANYKQRLNNSKQQDLANADNHYTNNTNPEQYFDNYESKQQKIADEQSIVFYCNNGGKKFTKEKKGKMPLIETSEIEKTSISESPFYYSIQDSNQESLWTTNSYFHNI